ncbi:enoyl-CoA hydratase-related protein [Kyrpidia tusciae]|uniref:Uncharacterized protein n=1 Tax=Kyrpidia tusciae (strain DSM 2912 / NBRC 15312 / T2) TaxID=562970 RepID=D5WWB6_KYRT2|nr:enoyl-CoA hydratase-related protein [Kyrpidia tusciae]ADG07681.1 hypothetical protein Btus_3062 [Kyrpidia tusciae DSM 2912]
MKAAVCNASPMIALSYIGLFRVLGQLFEPVTVPQAVWNEVMANRGAFGIKELKSAVEYGEVMVFQVQNQTLVEKLSGRLYRGELVYTGRILDARTALSMGVLNYVVPPEQLTDFTVDLARTVLRQSYASVVAVKRSVRRIMEGEAAEDTPTDRYWVYGPDCFPAVSPLPRVSPVRDTREMPCASVILSDRGGKT